MNDPIRPVPKLSLVPDPGARKDAEESERDRAEPGADENAAGSLKNVIDKPSEA